MREKKSEQQGYEARQGPRTLCRRAGPCEDKVLQGEERADARASFRRVLCAERVRRDVVCPRRTSASEGSEKAPAVHLAPATSPAVAATSTVKRAYV